MIHHYPKAIARLLATAFFGAVLTADPALAVDGGAGGKRTKDSAKRNVIANQTVPAQTNSVPGQPLPGGRASSVPGIPPKDRPCKEEHKAKFEARKAMVACMNKARRQAFQSDSGRVDSDCSAEHKAVVEKLSAFGGCVYKAREAAKSQGQQPAPELQKAAEEAAKPEQPSPAESPTS